MRENVDREHDKIYSQVKKLASNNCEEKMPCLHGGRKTRANPVVGLPSEYWKVTATIPFLDMIISEMNQRFADRRAHYELYSLVAEVIRRNEDLKNTADILVTKWEHPLEAIYMENYVDESNIVTKYL